MDDLAEESAPKFESNGKPTDRAKKFPGPNHSPVPRPSAASLTQPPSIPAVPAPPPSPNLGRRAPPHLRRGPEQEGANDHLPNKLLLVSPSSPCNLAKRKFFLDVQLVGSIGMLRVWMPTCLSKRKMVVCIGTSICAKLL
jgi:hypothetical protein